MLVNMNDVLYPAKKGKIAERIFMITLIGTLLGFGVKNINAATKSTQYKMVWSDEFNGTKLNLKNWTYDIGNGGANFGWGNNELEYYTDREGSRSRRGELCREGSEKG